MMSKLKPEEKFPLLFYFVDDPNECSKTNKRLYFERGRWHGINSGAANILTEWPNQLNSCMITILLSGITAFMFILLLVSAVNNHHSRIPRCIQSDGNETFDERTIHFVHQSKVWKEEELKLLDSIIHNFPDFKYHLITIINDETIIENHNDTVTSTLSSKDVNATTVIRKERSSVDKKVEDFKFSVQMGAKRLLDILLNNRRNFTGEFKITTPKTTTTTTPKYALEDILHKHNTSIINHEATYEKLFSGTTLDKHFVFLNDNLKIFAVRVLQLWQHGGISLALEDSLKNSTKVSVQSLSHSRNSSDVPEMFKLKKFISLGSKSFDKIREGSVIVDDLGLHMETRSKCHAFFEEVLLNLKRTYWKETTVKMIIRKSLKVFCQHAFADMEYCKSIKY